MAKTTSATITPTTEKLTIADEEKFYGIKLCIFNEFNLYESFV